jgi:hypothetical protein
VTPTGDRRAAYRVFLWEDLWERDHLENLRVKWEDDIKMDLQGVGWRDID